MIAKLPEMPSLFKFFLPNPYSSPKDICFLFWIVYHEYIQSYLKSTDLSIYNVKKKINPTYGKNYRSFKAIVVKSKESQKKIFRYSGDKFGV